MSDRIIKHFDKVIDSLSALAGEHFKNGNEEEGHRVNRHALSYIVARDQLIYKKKPKQPVSEELNEMWSAANQARVRGDYTTAIRIERMINQQRKKDL